MIPGECSLKLLEQDSTFTTLPTTFIDYSLVTCLSFVFSSDGKYLNKTNKNKQLGVVSHAFNPSIREAERDCPVLTYMNPYVQEHSTHISHTRHGYRERYRCTLRVHRRILSYLMTMGFGHPCGRARVPILFLPGPEPRPLLGMNIAHLLLWHPWSGLLGDNRAKRNHLEGRFLWLWHSKLTQKSHAYLLFTDWLPWEKPSPIQLL